MVMYMGKARDFKTFPRTTYQKIKFSLDLFLQLYFKILKYLFLVLKNCDTKSKTQILIIFSNEQLRAQKNKHRIRYIFKQVTTFPKISDLY